MKSKSKISEVVIGTTRDEGGSRDKKIVIGGETAMPFYYSENFTGNRPVISQDIFDMPISLPSTVRQYFSDSMEDPVEWAKKRVKDFNAGMITLHMVSSDPRVKDTPIKESCRLVEDLLQVVKVPLVLSGSGNPEKDPELLEKVAEISANERCLLSTVGPDMDYKKVAKAAIEYGHVVLSLVTLNPYQMKWFNRKLMKEGLTKEQIVMDPFTGGIGYGIEHSISTMESIRLMGLDNVEELMMPIASAPSNAWSAREAWMKNDLWGPREQRGPLWEASTAVATLLAGADLLMMLHPVAIEKTQEVISVLSKRKQWTKKTLNGR